MKGKIALYSRVSTSEQSEHGYSIHEQEQVLIKEVVKNFQVMTMRHILTQAFQVKILKVVRQ